MRSHPAGPDRPSSSDRPAQADRPTPDGAPSGAPSGAPDGAPAPADPAHDLSDSPVHAQSPDAYTEPPGSHRAGKDGPALDVGA